MRFDVHRRGALRRQVLVEFPFVKGAGLPVQTINEPYDSLNYASTVRALVGKTQPMPDRVVLF